MKKLFIALLAFNLSIDALDAAASQPALPSARTGGQDEEPERRSSISLVAATMERDVESVRSLLEAGVNPDEVDTSGMWALLVATIGRDIGIMGILLEAHANPNFSGSDDSAPSGDEEGSIDAQARRGGRLPLLEAAKSDFADGVELLLRRGALVNQEGRDFTTPLFGAVVAGAQNALEVLLRHGGADLERANLDGWRPLEAAIQTGHIGVVARLLRAGACTGVDNYDPLSTAATWGRTEAAALLLAKGAVVDADQSGFPLWIAARDGHVGMVALLLVAGANPNQANDGIPPLWTAAAGGQIEVVELLLGAGAAPNATAPSGTTPMSIAETNGHHEIAARLQLAGGQRSQAPLDEID